MRVGLIIYNDLNTRSGGYIYDRELVQYLKSQGDIVHLFSIPWRNYAQHLTDNFDKKLLQQIIEADLDILLQDELNHPSLAWFNQRLKAETNLPIISIIHHLRSKENHPRYLSPLYSFVEKRYLKSLDAWIAVSETTQADSSNLLGETRPHIIANPSAFRWHAPPTKEEIKKRAKHKGPLKIVFLANLIERKGLHVLLEALNKIPRDAWQLDIVGGELHSSKYADQIRILIRQFDLQKNINFIGWLDDASLESHLKTQDVLCVPSSYEGFGMVYLEGMGMGLPVIGCTSGAAKETITHEKDGFLIDYGDAKALSESLYQLYQQPELLLTMSLAAHTRYKKQLTWKETGAHIRSFLISQAG